MVVVHTRRIFVESAFFVVESKRRWGRDHHRIVFTRLGWWCNACVRSLFF